MYPSWRRDGATITTDPAEIDHDVVHGFLSASYWAQGMPRDIYERSVRGSIPFSVRVDGAQAGFARVISDRATIAYVGDVFVLEAYRGRGLSRFLMECMLAHPDLQNLRRWILATRDAHGLYAKFGFTPLAAPDRWMDRWERDLYARLAQRDAPL